jgi:hypothetical protein
MPLNWKTRGGDRYDALASRVVGGKYFIEWIESHYSEQSCERLEVRGFRVDYQYRGGCRGNISLTHHLGTLAKAQALAELDHARRKALFEKYGDERSVPDEAWCQFRRQMDDWQNFTEEALERAIAEWTKGGTMARQAQTQTTCDRAAVVATAIVQVFAQTHAGGARTAIEALLRDEFADHARQVAGERFVVG